MGNANFVTLVTFDCEAGRSEEVVEYIELQGFSRQAMNGRDLPRNIHLKNDYEFFDQANATSLRLSDIKQHCDRIADKYREDIKDFFDRNDIAGHIYVFVSIQEASDDSVSGSADWRAD
ncbi:MULTISPECIES: hypothetical protein [unclassified Providencia]|uniref:hypothetical protein n=1 Tax=unclassified Providencia TaxID=2633465 RepID=UPI0023490E90|nr:MULTISPECIES: hypothetical protein [unclassified Providencia]